MVVQAVRENEEDRVHSDEHCSIDLPVTLPSITVQNSSLVSKLQPTKSMKMFCKGIAQICGACLYWRKLMDKALPEDSWLRLSEKYLYPDLSKSMPLRPESRLRNIQPFNVSYYKQDKEKYKIIFPKRVIELLKINEKRRTVEQSQHISEHLALIEQLESCFTKSQFLKFGKVAWFDSFGPCRVLIRQGQFSDCFYLILSGKVNVKNSRGESTLLSAGEVFGLEELIQDELAPEGSPKFRRQTTYVTQTPVTVACVHRCDFESRHTDF